MQTKEKLADYVANIKRLVIKGYPTNPNKGENKCQALLERTA